jgi:RHS repeat-associated protein
VVCRARIVLRLALHLPTSSQAANLDLRYDANGNVISKTTPGGTNAYTFDALGRLKDEIEGNSPPHTLGYTANGEPRYRITAKGDTTTDDIDPLGRPVKRTDPVNGSAQPTLMAYDRLDQLTQLTAPNGAVTAFDIDGLGNIWKESSADRGSVDSTFDAAGNVLTRKDARGLTITQTYDALNRLTQIDSPASGGLAASTTRYTWDTGCANGIGRLCQKTDETGSTTYSYDARGNLLTTTRVEDGETFVTRHAYNNADRPVDQILPTGETLVPTLDAGGRVQTLVATSGSTTTSLASAIAYSATGQITAQKLGLTWLTVNYDSAGRADTVSATPSNAVNDSNGDVPLPGWALAVLGATLFGLTRRRPAGSVLPLFVAGLLTLLLLTPPPAEAADLGYDYDASGNVTSKTTASGTATYTYDQLDRLDTEAGPPGNRDHAYDANGNRTADGAGTTATFTPNTDRVATINGISVTLDAAGNLTADGTYKYLWNGLGQLGELRKPDNTLIATYYYDDRHRRTRKVTTAAAPQGATTTFYIYLPDGRLLAEMGGSGEALMTYVWNGDILTGIIVHQPQRTVYTVQVDHLGTPYQVRTIEGKIVWRWEPDGYGRTAPNEDVDGDGKKLTLNVRFPGMYSDRESGFFYNWHRYYSPKIGYISPDPIGIAGGLNTYAYVGGNPLSRTDPTGLIAAVDDAVVGGGLLILGCAASPGCRQVVSNAMSTAANGAGGAYNKVKEWCSGDSSREECKKRCVAQYERDAEECGVANAFWGKKGYQACMQRAGDYLGQCMKTCDGK